MRSISTHLDICNELTNLDSKKNHRIEGSVMNRHSIKFWLNHINYLEMSSIYGYRVLANLLSCMIFNKVQFVPVSCSIIHITQRIQREI